MSAVVATQPHNLPIRATTETCSGGTYIVTGANVGLGFEAAKHLVALGSSKVIMAVRNVTAGEKSKSEIETATGITNVAEVWALDLASFDSVKAFAKRVITELDRIDALIENAGVAISQHTLAEGHHLAVTVNVLSTVLLGVLLLPKMSESARKYNIVPHLGFVTSRVGFDSKDEWDLIKDDPLTKMADVHQNAMKTYPLSKLLETLTVRQLATLVPLSRTGVVINLTCPGFCKTELARNAPDDFKKTIDDMRAKYGRTAEDGSRTLLFGAVAGKESHGCLLDSCEVADDKVPDWVTDEEGRKVQEQVWELVASELESIEPGCLEKVVKQ